MLVRSLLALLAVALIVPHHLPLAAGEAAQSALVHLVDQLAVLGLAALVLISAEAALAATARRDDKYYAVIILFGFALGAIAGVTAFAILGETTGPVPYEAYYRGMRGLLFGGLVGSALYVVWRTVLNSQKAVAISRAEWYGAAVVLIVGVLGIAAWLQDFETSGRQVAAMTGGVVDWIGTGGCRTHALAAPSCLMGQIDPAGVRRFAWMAFGIFWVLVALCYLARLKVSRIRALMMVSLVVLGSVLTYVAATQAFQHLLEGKAGSMLFFSLGMAGVVIGHSLYLGWCREQALAEALVHAFGTQEALRAMVDARLARQIGNASVRRATLPEEARALVRRADHDGWLRQLVLNAQYSRPDDPRIGAIARLMGLGIAPPDSANLRRTAERLSQRGMTESEAPAAQLESIVREGSEFTNPDDYHSRLARIGFCVCRVEARNNLGTGFLIAPDLVMTNQHVIKHHVDAFGNADPQGLLCRFDYKVTSGNQTLSLGTEARVVEIVDWSPSSAADLEDGPVPAVDELDFAILRLERPQGELPIGERAEQGAPLRGWIPMREAALAPNLTEESARGQFLIVLQHPKGQPMQQDMGAVTALNSNGTRIRHEANTLPGSSGSPCFSIRDLSIFALHHAGGHSKTLNRPYNQAVPIGRILNLVRTRKKTVAFWERDPVR